MKEADIVSEELAEIIKAYSLVLVEELQVTDDDTGFRVPGMARVLKQVHSHRIFSLLNSMQALIAAKEYGVAMVVARSQIEAVAALHWDMYKVEQLIDAKDVGDIHDYLAGAAFRTRVERLIEKSGDEKCVKAPNILTMVDRLDKSKGWKTRDAYDHISEFVHPNSFGGFLYFVQHERPSDLARFNREGWHPEEVVDWLRDVASLAANGLSFLEAFDQLAEDIKALE